MIAAESVSFAYASGAEVLKDISFRIKKGEFVALIGQNGAGKTTLLKHFNGLLKPTKGRLLIGGLDTARARAVELARRVGFLFQNPDHQIFLPSVKEEIAFGPRNLGCTGAELKARVEEAASLAGISAYLEASPWQLSKGLRQRVALASVLSMRPDVLVLDEPTTGQDRREAREMMEVIRSLHRKGHTVVLVSHDMELVAGYAERVLVMAGGRLLLDGPAREVLYQEDVLVSAGLLSPAVVRLARPFQEMGLFRKVLTVEELYDEIISVMRGEKRVRQVLPA